MVLAVPPKRGWLAKLYRPIWEYDARTIGKDVTGHLVFELTTAGAFRALGRGRR